MTTPVRRSGYSIPSVKRGCSAYRLHCRPSPFDITMGDAPKIVTTNIEMKLEVYDARSGEHINTIADFYHNWPLLVYASQ